MLSLYTNYVIVDVRILVFMMKFMIYADYQVIKWARFALTNHLITCLCRLSRFTLRSSFFCHSMERKNVSRFLVNVQDQDTYTSK